MPDFTFRHGTPTMVDYTPTTGNVAAGSSVLIGNTIGWTMGITHNPIANGVLGAVACSGGVYSAMVASNYAVGSKVYKPTANAILTTTSTNNALVGFTVDASPAVNAIIKVIHIPFV